MRLKNDYTTKYTALSNDRWLLEVEGLSITTRDLDYGIYMIQETQRVLRTLPCESLTQVVELEVAWIILRGLVLRETGTTVYKGRLR